LSKDSRIGQYHVKNQSVPPAKWAGSVYKTEGNGHKNPAQLVAGLLLPYLDVSEQSAGYDWLILTVMIG
jgi:hypothetical protein